MKQLFFIFSLLGCMDVHAQRFVFTHTAEGITLADSGKPAYHYQAKTKSLNGRYPRANYIHPLYGFEGEVLTEDFPADHLHQRGIFCTWHQIFVNDYRVGDGWECRNINWEVDTTITAVSTNAATLYTRCYWNSDSMNGVKTNPQRFLKEECNLLYYNVDVNTRVFEFAFTFTALGATVKLGASEDEKHYSGFSARLALPNDVRFFSDTAELIPALNGNRAGRRVRMTGGFGNSKNLSFTFESGTAGKDGQQNWILRKEKSMQNIAWPGNSDYIIIRPDQPVKAYYKITITRNRKL